MQLKLHMITIEDLVPQDHFRRKLEAAPDFSFVYEITAPLYSKKYGRPPIAPRHIEISAGRFSARHSVGTPDRTADTDRRGVAVVSWVGFFDRAPDHSIISQLRRRRPTFRKIFRRLFKEVARQRIEKGLASGRLVATDSGHAKANASAASEGLVEMRETPAAYLGASGCLRTRSGGRI